MISSQNVTLFSPRTILIVFRKTVFYSHRHILKQILPLQNPNPLSDVNFPIPSFKTLHNPNFCFQVYFPVIPIKHSHSGLFKTQVSVSNFSCFHLHFSKNDVIIPDSNQMLVYFIITFPKSLTHPSK